MSRSTGGSMGRSTGGSMGRTAGRSMGISMGDDSYSSPSLMFWSIILGALVTWWIFKNRNQANESSKGASVLSEEERRDLAERRLRALERSAPTSVPSNPVTTTKNKRIVNAPSEKARDGSNKTRSLMEEPYSRAKSALNKSSSSRGHPETEKIKSKRAETEELKSEIDSGTGALQDESSHAEASESSIDADTKLTLKTEIPSGKEFHKDESSHAETSESSIDKETKLPRKKKRPPPVQIACEAVSNIFQTHVTVVPHGGSGSWGGEGWWKRQNPPSLSASKKNAIKLPLFESSDSNSGEMDWDSVFAAIFLEMKDLIHFESIQQAAVCHSRARMSERNGFPPYLRSGREGFPEFAKYSRQVMQMIGETIAKWLLSCESNFEESLPPENGLFSDDYDQTNLSPETANEIKLKEWEELNRLLSSEAPSISPQLVSQVAKSYDEQADDGRVFLHQVMSSALQSLGHALWNFSADVPTSIENLRSSSQILSNSLIDAGLASITFNQFVSDCLSLFLPEDSAQKVEDAFKLAPLFSASAYTLQSIDIIPQNSRNPSFSPFFEKQLSSSSNYPMCTFDSKNNDNHKAVLESRRLMKASRSLARTVLRMMLKKKDVTFEFIERIIETNQPLVYLAKEQYLDAEARDAVSASRPFLLGLASVWVEFCTQNLTEMLETKGTEVFDCDYLNAFKIDPRSKRRLIVRDGDEISDETVADKSFSGGTRFFFLSSALMQVALQPTLKIEGSFLYHFRKVFDILRATAGGEEKKLPDWIINQGKGVVAGWLGLSAFLDDPDISATLTDFSLLQLDWLMKAVWSQSAKKYTIPDWICIDAATWLSSIPRRVPSLLHPRQAERAVVLSTQLLQFGASGSSDSFSPIVLASLLRILSEFVHTGERRSKQKQRNRFGGDNDEDDDFLDIYHSFDHNDTGVTVFTNETVRTQLCPTLVRTFCTLDAVEGLDMDRDHTFDKYSVKASVSDLLLKLWNHPSGECRQSLSAVSNAQIMQFFASLTSAMSVFFDNAIKAATTTFKTMKEKRNIESMRFADSHASTASGGFLAARKSMSLIGALSQDSRISAVLGGTDVAGTADHGILVNAVIHFIDIMTSSDGGTAIDLEVSGSDTERTSSVFNRKDSMSSEDLQDYVSDLAARRIFVIKEIGLDVSVICHQLLALTTRWNAAAKEKISSPNEASPLILALARHQDVDISRYESIVQRLIDLPDPEDLNSTARVTQMVLKSDGYCDLSSVPERKGGSYFFDTEESKNRLKSARMKRIKHIHAENIASIEQISSFLKDLREARAKFGSAKIKPEDITNAEAKIFQEGSQSLTEEDYADKLGEWTVSSEPFAKPDDASSFDHYYDKTARSHISGSGKKLVKEARKCHKIVPTPHPNSSIFVCFAEERMDVCRALITGPIGTPYSLGAFIFDIFFSSAYPQVPPLMTFMTTGGGVAKFSPNLYNDGKVCLSLLGLTFSSDDSQRWDSSKSSLAQVLLSIQSQIFDVKEPFYNEGSGIPLTLKMTKAGQEASRKHNSMLRLDNLRYAVIAHLREPPRGFDEVVMRHFRMSKRRIVAQARRWMLEEIEYNPNGPYAKRFETAFGQLVTLLAAKLGQDVSPSLPPLKEDVVALRTLGVALHEGSPTDDRKPAAKTDFDKTPASETKMNVSLNPWLDPSTTRPDKSNDTPANDVDDDGDGDSINDIYD